MKNSHVILIFEANDTDILLREANGQPGGGMSLACRQGLVVISGVDPNPAKKRHRNFIDKPSAAAYLKRLGDLDFNEIADEDDRTPREQLAKYATFDERFGDSKIVHPPSQLGFKN